MPLSEEDKSWIKSQLDPLSEQLDSRFKQIDSRFKQIDSRFEQMNSRFEQMGSRFDQLDQKIERVETSLLTEFHKWASPMEARQRTHTATLRALDLEMEYLADKIKNLEQRP